MQLLVLKKNLNKCGPKAKVLVLKVSVNALKDIILMIALVIDR